MNTILKGILAISLRVILISGTLILALAGFFAIMKRLSDNGF